MESSDTPGGVELLLSSNSNVSAKMLILFIFPRVVENKDIDVGMLTTLVINC